MLVKQEIKPKKIVEPLGHINLNTAKVEAIQKAKINDVIELKVKVKVTSLRAPDRWEVSNGKKPTDISASLEILSVNK